MQIRVSRKLLLLALMALVVALPWAAAQAAQLPLSDVPPTTNPKETNLWEIYNNVAGSMIVSSNADLHTNFYEPNDAVVGGGGGQPSYAALVAVNAEFLLDVGFYTNLATGTGKTDLFMNVTGEGMFPLPYDAALLPDDPFGWFLETTDPMGMFGGDTWHSDNMLDVGGTFDHMASYNFAGTISVLTDEGLLMLQNARMIGWEDVDEFADGDYNDLVLVTGTLVPEPGTALLMALGLTGLSFLRRSRR